MYRVKAPTAVGSHSAPVLRGTFQLYLSPACTAHVYQCNGDTEVAQINGASLHTIQGHGFTPPIVFEGERIETSGAAGEYVTFIPHEGATLDRSGD